MGPNTNWQVEGTKRISHRAPCQCSFALVFVGSVEDDDDDGEDVDDGEDDDAGDDDGGVDDSGVDDGVDDGNDDGEDVDDIDMLLKNSFTYDNTMPIPVKMHKDEVHETLTMRRIHQ